ncbi:UNVERIFIED_CONTAM: hypothetical protein FKN15_017843 [Acipenser sinensis]
MTVQLQSSFTPQSSDIAFEPGPDYQGGRHIHGRTLTPEVPGGPQPCVHLIWTPPPASLSLPASQSSACWVFLTALADTAERAQSCYSEGLALIGSGDLLPSHRRAWAELWAGSAVQVKSPAPLQQAVIGCLYYLLSSLPPLKPTDFLFGGLSPAGLSNGRRGEDYWGHVFWDQDTWMYPPVLLFYPELARAILRYRIHTLRGAAHNAAQQGLKGVKFAWESAVTGQEVCPDEIYGLQEIHINGDVCFRLRHCLLVKSSLQFAVDLAILLQTPPPPEWQEISDKIKVPFDPEEKYHPEFDGYQKGKINKNSLNFDPTLPDDISDLQITGVCYLGNKLDFTFSKEGVTVVLARVWGPQHCALELVLTQSGKSLPLNQGTRNPKETQ